MNRTTRLTLILVMANMVVYLIVFGAWLLRSSFPELADKLTETLSLSSAPDPITGSPWSLLTYMFSHIDFIHLAINMLWLIGFGGRMKGGPLTLLTVYFAGGVCGAFAFLTYTRFFDNGEATLIGASSSVIAVVIATTILSPDQYVGIFWSRRLQMKWIAPVALLTLFGGMSAAACAHLGGAFAGIICGITLSYHRLRRSRATREAALNECKRLARRSALLSKASNSGFASLTDNERLELFNLSDRQAVD